MTPNQNEQTEFDIVVIGGGINGTGIARDAAGRGYTVCLLEQGDLAQATSSASTKLIHGGLRYLEHYAFRLVRESVQERAVLQGMAPHIIWPMRFILPHHKGLRPGWLIRLGLFIYDHIGGRRSVPASTSVQLRAHPAGAVLSDSFTTAFAYSDCWVEDSRLVVLNAVDANRHGAEIRTHTTLISAQPDNNGWRLNLQTQDGRQQTISARLLVNAAGPWAVDVLHRAGLLDNQASLRLIKGSHLILDKKLPSEDAFLLQNTDGRITFMIPYEGRFTLVGTTDVDLDMSGLTGKLDISDDEADYLLNTINSYLRIPVSQTDIVASYAGVRPLFDDGSGQAAKANRDYHLKLDRYADAPLLSVFGGKLTTYRRLAESALGKINSALGEIRPNWTATAPLPGGDFASQSALLIQLQDKIRDISDAVALRLVRAYGTEVFSFVGTASCMADLGEQFGCGLSEAELRYLMKEEYALTADDILMRRSKLYLHLSNAQKQKLVSWLSAEREKRPASNTINQPVKTAQQRSGQNQ